MKIEAMSQYYVSVNDIARLCTVMNAYFEEDVHILTYEDGKETKYIVASTDELFGTKEECEEINAERKGKIYDSCYNSYENVDEIILELLYRTMTGNRMDDLEMMATINRASDLTGIDMMSGVNEYINTRKKDCNEDEIRKAV